MRVRSSRVAFVLSGGATHGAVQVGMLQALLDAGIVPDLLVGTSVGAMNAAVFSPNATPEGLKHLRSLWIEAPRSLIFPLRARGSIRRLRSRDRHLFPNAGLRTWIESNLRYQRLEEFPIPLHVMATDMATHSAVQISHGDAATALLASASLPGVFPPVERGGRVLADGGTTANIPVGPAMLLGATRIYVLSPQPGAAESWPATEAASRVSRINEAALRALDNWFGRPAKNAEDAIEAQASEHIKRNRIEVVRLPSPYVADVSPFSFRHSSRLIDEAFAVSAAWLADNEEGASGHRVGTLDRSVRNEVRGRSPAPLHTPTP